MGAYHPSIAVTLQRMAVLLSELGTSNRQEAIDKLSRSREIFESNLVALESLKEKVEQNTCNKNSIKKNTVDNDDDDQSGKAAINLLNAIHANPVINVAEAVDPRTNAPLLPIGNTLDGTIRLRREQLADVLELQSELLCANGNLMESKIVLERSVSALRRISITVSKLSSNSLLDGVTSITSHVPPLRWATTLTNLGLVERALGNETEARIHLLEALGHVEAHVGVTVHAAEILEHIAVGHVMQNERVKSAVLRERVLGIVAQYHPSSMSLAIAHENLGEDYYALKKFTKSEEQFQSGLVLREHLGTLQIKLANEAALNSKPAVGDNDFGNRQPPNMKEDLRAAEIGKSVDDVINRLQKRDLDRRKNKPLSPLAPQNAAVLNETDPTHHHPILSGPKVLMDQDIQRSYINVATAGISAVKKNKGIRKKEAQAAKKSKLRARKLRLADDRKYVQDRALRHQEGLVKLTGLRE